MEDGKIRFTLRIDDSLMKKFGYIAEFEGRTKNKVIEQLLKKHIIEFEKEYGEIDMTKIK